MRKLLDVAEKGEREGKSGQSHGREKALLKDRHVPVIREVLHVLGITRIAETGELAVASAFPVVLQTRARCECALPARDSSKLTHLRGRLTVELEDGGAFASDGTLKKVNVVDGAGGGGRLIRLTVKELRDCQQRIDAAQRIRKQSSLDTLEAGADESVAASDCFCRADDEVDRNVGDLGNALDIVVLHGVAKRIDPDRVLV